MRSTLDELARELEELRALVASITPVNLALAEHHDSLVRQYLTIRRRFDYAAFVVALYASFEKFAENVVAAYVRLMALRSQYSALPAGLIRKHMVKSAEILIRGRLGEGRYVGVREIDVVKNLFECISGTSPYLLNEAAVVAHDSNLRFDELGKLFSSIGLDQLGERARRGDSMMVWYCLSQGLSEPPQGGVPAATVQQRLDDLVERRNQVTHRGGSPEELLGTAEMTDLVDFVDAFARSLYSATVSLYLLGRYVASSEALQLRLLEGPYKNGTVVVVEKPARRLYVGQPIFVLVEGTGARWGRILGIQLQGVSIDAVEVADPAVEVGLEVGFKCPKTAELFVLDAGDDVVWDPATLDGPTETVATTDG